MDVVRGFRDYQFQCNSNAGDETAHIWSPQESEMTGAGGVLDFAWNNQRVRFNTSNTTTTANTSGTAFAQGPTVLENFRYQGSAQELTSEWTQWRTNDLEDAPFDMLTTGTRRFNAATGSEGYSKKGKIKHALMQIFKEPDKKLLEEMDKEDKQLLEAKRKSEKLLKTWLTKAEYDALINKGEMEIQSEEEDVIFIVKRDPNEMVDVKRKGKFSHKLCAVPEDLDFPVGDQLLSKVILIKTDEKKFKKIAIKHGGHNQVAMTNGSTFRYDEI